MRYGHQPHSEIVRLPVRRLFELADGIMAMIEAENEQGRMER
jgi:hypothetical protein